MNILILMPLDPNNLARIRTAAPGAQVIEAARLMPRLPPDNGPTDPAQEKELDDWLDTAEVVLGFILPPRLIARAPGLKWVQVISAGVDRMLTREIAASPVILTNVSGIHAAPISETVFAFILSFAKQMPQLGRRQSLKQWQRTTFSILEGKTLGIVGLGHIGRRVALIGKAFGMRVIAIRRHAASRGKARAVDVLHPREKLLDLLAASDYVVDCLPATPETARMIGEAELRSMKPTAYLINIGRGSTIDEAALVQALRERWIAGAGLDTVQREPLPPDSPLWDMPNVIITPHSSGSMDDYMDRAVGIFCENLKRYTAGRRLTNVVNKKLGY